MRRSQAFSDKVVVITGAASGIGRELARNWAKLGAKVALLDIDIDGVNRLAGEIGQDRSIAIHCDICSLQECQQAVRTTLDAWGRIDVLANNAGISHHSKVTETDLPVLRNVMEVNFFGSAQLTHCALPHLIESKGRIVVLSSVAGFAPLLGRAGYVASKHALQGFFATLRAEMRPHKVAVTLVCPSYVETAIDRHALSGDGGPLRESKTTVGKVLQADAVAKAIVNACAARRDTLLLSPIAKLSYWISRLAPQTYERAMRRSAR
jgi:NADP-dependent 3-hydroxy acid dehydrogenase YdfG